MRAELILRRNVLIAAIRDSLPEATLAIVPKGGFHVWIQLPDGQSDIAIARAAAQRGLVVSPGSHWFPAEAPAPFLRLTFAAAPPAVLRRGIKLLGELLLK
jgi:DNA-binding transcriptional MocR family regulator